MITRKTYKAVAKILSGIPILYIQTTPYISKTELMIKLVDYLQNDNPRFDPLKFEYACFNSELETV